MLIHSRSLTFIFKQLKGIKRFFLRHMGKTKKFLRRLHNRAANSLFSLPKADNEISIHAQVIAYPLKELAHLDYSGGLINSTTHKLIAESIYYKEEIPCQHFTNFNTQENLDLDVPEFEDTCLYIGILFNHYGHFLLESLGRLWAYESVKELNPYICFYAPWGVPKYLEENNYVNQVLTGFKIPHERLIFLEHLVRLKKVVVPQQKYGYGYLRNPDSVFFNFVKTFSFKDHTPQGFENADKIYVSRAKLPFSIKGNVCGRAIAESVFEEYLISNDYKIFYPEFYNLFEQLTVYKNAKKIIFSSGSALHTCILLPDLQADVAIISRSQDPGNNLVFEEQFQGYRKTVFWAYAIRAQYQFGLDSWAALSDIDYYKASILLEKQGFVDKIFNNFNQHDYSNIVRSEIQNYIQSISNDTNFINFMTMLKE
ncbi:MAG: hypothetical protein DCF20_12645 [Pseudanabaena sp.]|nr:MAG: hypothetical protein DCF20_12645 [Pseudanabaena sp.]